MTNGKAMHTLTTPVAIDVSSPFVNPNHRITLPGVATPGVSTVLSELRPGA
jgi:hypothetical protein